MRSLIHFAQPLLTREVVMVQPEHQRDALAGLSRATSEGYFPHEVRRESPVLATQGAMRSRDLGEVRVVNLNWGAAVHVRTSHQGGCAVNVPLRGRMTVRSRAGSLDAKANQALVSPAGTEVEFPHWGGDVVMLGVRIGEEYLRRQLDLADIREDPAPRLLDLSTGVGRQWLQFVRGLLPAPDNPDTELLTSPLVAGHLSAAIASGLVAVLADTAGREPVVPGSRRVSAAVAAIESDPARAWTVAEIAAVAGCGVRTLQQSFREATGSTPMEYLRSVRLDVIHEELSATDPASEETVTDIALRWGVAHLGRFSVAYRKRFGETPSATLRS